MRIRTVLTLAGITAGGLLVAQDQMTTLKVDVDVVSILASVRDKRGGLVPNLEKADFTILEDGKAQPIKYFARETDLPLTIGLLVDVSGSQRNLIDIERSAASQFFRDVLRKKDLAFLISFGEESELLQVYTASPRLLTVGLNQLRVSSGVGGIHPGPVFTGLVANLFISGINRMYGTTFRPMTDQRILTASGYAPTPGATYYDVAPYVVMPPGH